MATFCTRPSNVAPTRSSRSVRRVKIVALVEKHSSTSSTAAAASWRSTQAAAAAAASWRSTQAAAAAASWRSTLAAAAAAATLLWSGAAAAAPNIDAVRAAVRADFVDRQYYITGDLTRSLYADDCVFVDPTTTVTGPDRYARAVTLLFDPATSRADLIALEKTDDAHLVLRWRLEGRLRAGGLAIKPYTGTTTYTLGGGGGGAATDDGSDSGKITRHEETWDISALDAFASVLFPSFGAPPAPPVAGPPPP